MMNQFDDLVRNDCPCLVPEKGPKLDFVCSETKTINWPENRLIYQTSSHKVTIQHTCSEKCWFVHLHIFCLSDPFLVPSGCLYQFQKSPVCSYVHISVPTTLLCMPPVHCAWTYNIHTAHGIWPANIPCAIHLQATLTIRTISLQLCIHLSEIFPCGLDCNMDVRTDIMRLHFCITRCFCIKPLKTKRRLL